LVSPDGGCGLMTAINHQVAAETCRRDRIEIYRRRVVAGSAALRLISLRPKGFIAEALLSHIERCARPDDRELFHLGPIQTDAASAEPESMDEKPSGGEERTRYRPDLSVSLNCPFCPDRLRICEDGRPLALMLDICKACGCRMAISVEGRAAIQAAIEAGIMKHLP
jgi:hypothetical protein